MRRSRLGPSGPLLPDLRVAEERRPAPGIGKAGSSKTQAERKRYQEIEARMNPYWMNLISAIALVFIALMVAIIHYDLHQFFHR